METNLMKIRIKIQRPNIFHFKAFGMINLHYEIRICQKIYNRVTMTVYVKGVVWFNVNKTLIGSFYVTGYLRVNQFDAIIMDLNSLEPKDLENLPKRRNPGARYLAYFQSLEFPEFINKLQFLFNWTMDQLWKVIYLPNQHQCNKTKKYIYSWILT